MNKRLNLLKLTVIAVVVALIIPMLPVTEAQAATSKSYWDGYSTDYYYKQLSSKEKTFYKALDKECYRILSTKTNLSKSYGDYVTKKVTGKGLSSSQIAKVCQIFRMCEPQYYFLESKYWYGSGYGQLVVYSNYAKGETRAKATKKIKAKLDKWVKAAKEGTDKAEKLRLADAAICGDAVYQSNSLDQSMAGIILKGEGVCTSYAMCFEAVSNKLGCDCVMTCGHNHAWNKVKVDGTWYLADICWEDSNYPANYWLLISDSTAKSRDGYSITHENNENPKGIKVPSANENYGEIDLDEAISHISFDYEYYKAKEQPQMGDGNAKDSAIVKITSDYEYPVYAEIYVEYLDFNGNVIYKNSSIGKYVLTKGTTITTDIFAPSFDVRYFDSVRCFVKNIYGSKTKKDITDLVKHNAVYDDYVDPYTGIRRRDVIINIEDDIAVTYQLNAKVYSPDGRLLKERTTSSITTLGTKIQNIGCYVGSGHEYDPLTGKTISGCYYDVEFDVLSAMQYDSSWGREAWF